MIDSVFAGVRLLLFIVFGIIGPIIGLWLLLVPERVRISLEDKILVFCRTTRKQFIKTETILCWLLAITSILVVCFA